MTIKTCIAFLNELLAIDPEAISALVTDRVPCNQTLADHPTVQVAAHGDGPLCENIPAGEFRVGMLGIINGLFGRPGKPGPISAVYNDAGQLTTFTRNPHY